MFFMIKILLVVILLIYIIFSKPTPIIVKNNLKSFLIQTILSSVAIIITWNIHGDIYDYSNSAIIYNTPGFPNYWGMYKPYNPYFAECIIRTTVIILYIVFGTSLTKEKSKTKNFLSVFICYLILIIIDKVASPRCFENLYVWIPYLFISESSNAALQRTTPLIYHMIFLIILFIPTIFIWLGVEIKCLYDNRCIKRRSL
jgi:hypothetical protein